MTNEIVSHMFRAGVAAQNFAILVETQTNMNKPEMILISKFLVWSTDSYQCFSTID